jgi:hypothetical protein
MTDLRSTVLRKLAATVLPVVTLFGSLGGTSSVGAQTQTAVEYYYDVWNFYFETSFPDEIAALDGGAFGGAWKRTGQTFAVWTQGNASAMPTCRFFSTAFAPKSTHFYTPFTNECALVKASPAWQYEGIAFYIALADANGLCGAGTIPLYRLYNNGMGGAPNHRYTASLVILNQMLAAGWLFEGNGNTKVFACVPSASPATISDIAYQLISRRTVANRQSFYVYLDQDSGFNHGFPSGFFSQDSASLGTIHIDTGCIYDATAANGCSTDPNVLDRSRGTVLRISFDAQTAGNFAGINIEEPENWGVLQTGNGYDLRGANSVTFDVWSPNGARVQFSIGGCTTAYTDPIPKTWTTVTIALNSLSCSPDLSAVHILFGVATNDEHAPNGATVLLDNVQFNPVPNSRQSALGFPLGNQVFGVLPRQNVPIPIDQVLRNLTTIYESALTELALLTRGNSQDLANARLIADTFDYALHHDSHGDTLPAPPDGSLGLHSGYENGDIALFNNQQPPKQGQAGDVRLAGFTATTLCAPSGFCLVLDGATGGNNALAILALVAAYGQFGDTRYLNDALMIGKWIVGNLADTTGSGYGGYYVGLFGYDVGMQGILNRGKSTENNADIFAAFTALATVESQLGNSSAAASWTTAANVAGDFVMQMFDSPNGRFNVGTVPAGTSPPSGAKCQTGIWPTGAQKGNDVINVCDFLDSNTFTTLAMAGSPRYQNQIDWREPIQYVLNHFAQTVTAAGTTFQGFDIVPTPVSGPNGIAWEFTGQAVEAMRFVDQLYGDTRFESSADAYLAQIALAQASAPFGDGLGLVAATLQNGDALPPSQQCLQTPFQCIAERVGLAATAWAVFAERKSNLFRQ